MVPYGDHPQKYAGVRRFAATGAGYRKSDMYGTWYAVTLSGIGVIMLAIAAAFLWAPLFALVAFAAIGTLMLVIAAMRRTEDLPGRATHRGDPERYAAPASGEGGSAAPSGDRREPFEPEQAPAPESTGAWGERR
jgi:hypothetical protein